MQPLRSLVSSVPAYFGPKDRTDLATLVLRKPKYTVYLYSVKYFLRCMFIIFMTSVIEERASQSLSLIVICTFFTLKQLPQDWITADIATIYKRSKTDVIFTALHVMQTRYSEEILSVCLSVRLSVTRVYCDKTVESSVQIYILYERTFSLVF